MNSDDLKDIWDKFTKKVDSDDKLRRLYKLAEEGNASYEDARTLSSVFSDIIVDSAVDVCPGQVEEITEALKDDLLGKRYYKELNGYVSKVQKSYNESLGLGINPVDVSTNRNLIPKDFEPVEDYQKAISSLRRQTELSSNKFVDHVQRKNAAFQSNDFDVTVSRTYDRVGLSEGRTCKWCLARTGKNVPYDLAVKMGMFERHEGCHCEIEYNNNGIKTYQSGKGGRDSFKRVSSASKFYLEEYDTADEYVAKLTNLAKRKDGEITPVIKSVSRKLGCHLDGLNYRIKSSESLKRKIILKANEKNISPKEYSSIKITDVLRYTTISSEETFTSNYFSFQELMRENGINIIECTNTFCNDCPYKGVNTLMQDESGYIFEVQFHTEESLKIKNINHKLYEEERLSETPKERKFELQRQMMENSKNVDKPKNVAKIINIVRSGK